VTDIVAPALGLPEWTLKLVIVLGLILFPVVGVLSWLIDITPNGLVADVGPHRQAERPHARRTHLAMDGALLFAALVIGAQLTAGMIGTAASGNAAAKYRIAVESVGIAGPDNSARLGDVLLISLQHRLNQLSGVTVVDARDAFLTRETLRLSTVVVADGDVLQVTTRLVEHGSGQVTWSETVQWPLRDGTWNADDIAGRIAASLPLRRDTEGRDDG